MYRLSLIYSVEEEHIFVLPQTPPNKPLGTPASGIDDREDTKSYSQEEKNLYKPITEGRSSSRKNNVFERVLSVKISCVNEVK